MPTKNALKSLALLLAALAPGLVRAQAGPCADPWINTAFHQMYGRSPVGSGKNVGECDITRYGNGHWSSYQDLTSKIAQHAAANRTVAAPPTLAPATSYHPLAATQPSLIRNGSSGIISQDGGSLIRNGSSGIVAQGGGNIVAQGGGNIVAQGGGNMTSRSLQSVDRPRAPAGKYLVTPTGSLVDANGNVVRGAGTYTLVARNGSYTVGTGAGVRAPTAGMVVAP